MSKNSSYNSSLQTCVFQLHRPNLRHLAFPVAPLPAPAQEPLSNSIYLQILLMTLKIEAESGCFLPFPPWSRLLLPCVMVYIKNVPLRLLYLRLDPQLAWLFAGLWNLDGKRTALGWALKFYLAASHQCLFSLCVFAGWS